MKALIVDDEKHVREAVKMLIEWRDYRIDTLLEASDGLQAKELIESERPEFIFTDIIMPFMDGVELLAWIRSNAPASKTIVISGHDDFHLVRLAMKHGGLDYILKPIDPEQLEETFAHAVKSWNEEEQTRIQQQRRSMEINQIKQVYWDKLFSSLITEPNAYLTIKHQLASEFRLDDNIGQCQIAIISVETLSHATLHKFGEDRDLLFFALANIANEWIRNSDMGYAFRCWNDGNELAILLWRKLDSTHSMLANINEGIRQVLGEYADIGVGTISKFPEMVAQSRTEARSALRYRNLVERAVRIHTYNGNEEPHVQAVNNEHLKENIVTAVRSNVPEQIEAAIGDWLRTLKRLRVVTIEDLTLWRQEYENLKMRLLKGIAAPTPPPALKERAGFALPLDKSGRLAIGSWEAEFTSEMIAIAASLSEHMRLEHNVAADIAAYIDQHYAENISLKDLSDRFYVSREYISRKFKQEFQENISEYLERIRIEKARLLLQNPLLKVAQVSELVGYQDEKYFSKVFKKAVGLSPKQFRTNRA